MPEKSGQKLKVTTGKETIGERLARLRKERGYTQVELAKKMGIVQALISDYEVGKLRLHAEMAAKFAQVLGVSTDEIIGTKAPKESASNASKLSLRFLRRLKKIGTLSPSQQKTLLQTIDNFIEGAASKGKLRKAG